MDKGCLIKRASLHMMSVMYIMGLAETQTYLGDSCCATLHRHSAVASQSATYNYALWINVIRPWYVWHPDNGEIISKRTKDVSMRQLHSMMYVVYVMGPAEIQKDLRDSRCAALDGRGRSVSPSSCGRSFVNPFSSPPFNFASFTHPFKVQGTVNCHHHYFLPLAISWTTHSSLKITILKKMTWQFHQFLLPADTNLTLYQLYKWPA